MRVVCRLVLFCAVFYCSLAPAAAATKKGVAIGAHDPQAAERIETLGAGWYYTWNTTPVAGVGAEFVPMAWGRKPVSLAATCHLLLFNEPDGANQADLSVEEAVRLAAPLSLKARYVVSPSAVNALGGWFVHFDAAAEQAGIDLDYVAMHWYGGPSVRQFLRKVDAVHERYGKPIWITEFAVADWKARPGRNRYSAAQTARFLEKVLPELERRPFVARYAWMGAGTLSPAIMSSRLFDDEGRLTEVGEVYRAFRSAEQPRPRDC